MTSAEVSCSVDPGGDVLVVSISGRLDASCAAIVRQKLLDVASNEGARVVVDLAKLEWIDSSGVGALITLYKRLRSDGGDVKVARLDGQPKEIFRLLRLEAALEAFDSVAGAVEKLATC